jgi:hypothetical protein
MQVRIHAHLQHRDASELVELPEMGIVVEGAGDEHVEVGIAGLACGGHRIGSGNDAELRANGNSGAFLAAGLGVALAVAAFGADQFTRPGRERREGIVKLIA